MKEYLKEEWAGMAHWVTPGVPSMCGVPVEGESGSVVEPLIVRPCQCIVNPSLCSEFLTFTTIRSPRQTWAEKEREKRVLFSNCSSVKWTNHCIPQELILSLSHQGRLRDEARMKGLWSESLSVCHSEDAKNVKLSLCMTPWQFFITLSPMQTWEIQKKYNEVS